MVYDQFADLLPEPIFQLVFATLLGLFLGLEREWSNKPAGIRTFSLVALVGVLFGIYGSEQLVAAGAVFVIVLALLLGAKGLLYDDVGGLSLTTSVSLLVVYGVGVFVAEGLYLEAVVVAFISSLLLVLKRELHEFTASLSKEEVRSATEFAIIAFVVYPLLPDESFGPWDAIDAQLIWLLVIAVSGIGFINYVLVKLYREKGIWVTGFFGGLVNSTAVIISITDRVGEFEGSEELALGSILLANAAMSIRNLAIAVVFLPALIIELGIPLLFISVAGVLLAYVTLGAGMDGADPELSSPFSTRNALVFGGIFLLIVVLSSAATNFLGDAAFVGSMFTAGLVSSGSSTATVVTLFSSEQIGAVTAVYGVLAGTIASIIVKIALAGMNARAILVPTILYNLVLILAGVAGVGVVLVI